LSDARNYYKVINLDSRIEGADQCVCSGFHVARS
jgi:hypothetical protein